MAKEKVLVIGAGFAGLSAAAYLGKAGFDVEVFDKLDEVGGRAQVLKKEGFMFDMGPSWYWMPEIFENWFADFGHLVKDHYELQQLHTAYRVFYGKNDHIDVSSSREKLAATFESIEPGSAKKLEKFLNSAKQKYEIAFDGFIDKPALSPLEYVSLKTLKGALSLNLFQSVKTVVAKHFKHPKLRSLLEFPVLFLGAMPKDTPALYTLMNHADLNLGTWYPMGGMQVIAKGMKSVAEEKGVKFNLGSSVESIEVENGKATGIRVNGEFIAGDYVIGAADYHFVDQKLLPKSYSNYSNDYWNSRVMAPSALLFYIGINKKLKGLEHHNLFFDEDFDVHGRQIYADPQWPARPQMYLSVSSKTDPDVAPAGGEAIVGLIPIASGIKDSPEIREKYKDKFLSKVEKLTGENFRESIVFIETYCLNDFVSDYNSFKGNAYGLANTIRQTAFLKPKIKNTKLRNVYYAGQLTVPGPGVPPALISGRVVANEICRIRQ